MIKLKTGKIVFFEGIMSMYQSGEVLCLVTADGNTIKLRNEKLEDMIEARNDYFAQMYATGAVSAEFGNQTLGKLKDEAETLISTLQAATTAYNSSAELANAASVTLANTSEKVDRKSQRVFKDSEIKANDAAKRIGVVATSLEKEFEYLKDA